MDALVRFVAPPGKPRYEPENIALRMVRNPEAPAVLDLGNWLYDCIEFASRLVKYMTADQRPDTINEQLHCIVIIVNKPVQVWDGTGSGEPFFGIQRVAEGAILLHCQFAFEAEPGNIQDIDHHYLEANPGLRPMISNPSIFG